MDNSLSNEIDQHRKDRSDVINKLNKLKFTCNSRTTLNELRNKFYESHKKIGDLMHGDENVDEESISSQFENNLIEANSIRKLRKKWYKYVSSDNLIFVTTADIKKCADENKYFKVIKPTTEFRESLSSEDTDYISPSLQEKKSTTMPVNRSANKSVLEDVAEKVSTPTKPARRRSTARSIDEEAPATPTRRSSRLLQNTSISDLNQIKLDSPRALRAARRTSTDELVLTPTRVTRRTRKDSIENNVGTPTALKSAKTLKDIIEEPDVPATKTRKSTPRAKTSPKTNNKQTKDSKKSNKSVDNTILEESLTVNDVEVKDFTKSPKKTPKRSPGRKSIENKSEDFKENETLGKENNKSLNKSVDNIISKENVVVDDLEPKDIIKSPKKTPRKSPARKSIENKSEDFQEKEVEAKNNRSLNKSKENASDFTNSPKRTNIKLNDISETKLNEKTDSPLRNTNTDKVQVNNDLRSQSEPKNENFQVTIESSSSSDDINDKVQIQEECEDQCVPVLNTDEIDNTNKNDSCEPMDIDETIPDNFSFSTNKKDKSINNNVSKVEIHSKKDISINKSEIIANVDETQAKSPTKRLSKSISENNNSLKNTSHLEKSIANKSTLIISQVKDDSATNESLSKSKESSKNNSKLEKSNKTEDHETPIKNMKLKSLGVKTSTPVVLGNKNKPIANEKIESVNNSDSDSDDDSDASSEEASKLVIDEAEEASDDYESGDSMNESEISNLKHEIIDKGESLHTTDEDDSTDSDYEKDSFIASSCEESGMLDSTDEDLAYSDVESKKPKDKFAVLKIKKQAAKNVSAETKKQSLVSESDLSNAEDNLANQKPSTKQRLDSSGTDSPLKQTKSNRKQRLDSSGIDSPLNQTKSSKKQRLDSSGMDSPLKQTSSKNRMRLSSQNNSLSEMQTSSNNIDEKEITVNNESIRNDPLQTSIKVEPKTPLKLDMSVVNVTTQLPIEQVNVNEDATMMNDNDSDPLEDDSDCSENQNIKNNYDSMLKDLSKNNKKTHNLSLDSKNAKTNKTNNKIINELNLTSSKNNKQIKKNKPAVEIDSDSSDGGLDLNLLFSDSSDSDNTRKNTEKSNTSIIKEVNKSVTNDKSNLDISLSKKKNRKSSETVQVEVIDNDVKNNSLNESISNKKKKNRISESSTKDDVNSSVADMNISQSKESQKKKNRKSKDTSISECEVMKDVSMNDINEGNNQESHENTFDKSTSSMKKNQRLSIAVENSDLDVSTIKESIVLDKTLSSKKKKKLSETVENVEVNTSNVKVTNDKSNLDISLSKKKNRKSSETVQIEVIDNDINCSKSDESSKKKNRKSKEASVAESDDVVTIDNADSNAKDVKISKKRKRSLSPMISMVLDDEDSSFVRSNKRQKIVPEIPNETDEVDSSSVSMNSKKQKTLPGSATCDEVESTKKRNKKRKRKDIDEMASDQFETPTSNIITPLPENLLAQLDDKPKQHKKKPKIVSTSQFVVENATTIKKKPSNYLEESVYLDDDDDSPQKGKSKQLFKKPKVLPSVPTASTSSFGFTSKFEVKVISKPTFTGSDRKENFKTSHLQGKIKRMGTYELYKRQRKNKLVKF